MEKLSYVNELVISQKKEMGEILTGIETKNKYIVLDTTGKELYTAVEEGGSMMMRMFLKALRPFEIRVNSYDGKIGLRVNRPFRFYFHKLEVFESSGKLLGTIQRQFDLLRRVYSVLDITGREVFQLFGPILHPWTFEIKKKGVTQGKIVKKWSGLIKEGFTDADNFGIVFPQGCDVKLKALLLGAVFLIDFVHFENKGKN